MPEFILRMEGVDFGATVMDTHNLSAFRGGSLALLAAPQDVRRFLGDAVVETIFEGASQGAWIVKADDAASAEALCKSVRAHLKESGAKETAQAVYPHLSFVDAAAEGNDYAALIRAEAKNRARQFQRANWTPPDFEEGAAGYSEVDRMRPAVVKRKVKGVEQLVSRSFAARFDYGKAQRQDFYRDNVPDEFREEARRILSQTKVAHSFEDMIRLAPEGLSGSLTGKIAVFYADGNRFGKIRAEATSVPAYREFSTTLVNYTRFTPEPENPSDR